MIPALPTTRVVVAARAIALGLLVTSAYAEPSPYREPLSELRQEMGAPGPPPSEELSRERTRQISRGLRCPVCQGSSIQDSPVESAVNMRRRVQELVEAGYEQRAIEDYFVRRYGEWVLLNPRATGANWIVWLLPALGGGVALGGLVYVVAQWRREEDPVPLPSDTGQAPLDEFERRLLEEIER
ncbi:MAG: cytochrome c-type biogenesis protein CcmH [Deltaproteobacteria bacterium]|nr:MAG: cytochrome c-type biogenesis protein CcmH [Deltaproteobacteria bacterium]